MTSRTLVSILHRLKPAAYASSPEYARRTRLEWRVLLALVRVGHLRPLDGRAWTRAQLLKEALRPRLVLVVDNEARGECDTVP